MVTTLSVSYGRTEPENEATRVPLRSELPRPESSLRTKNRERIGATEFSKLTFPQGMSGKDDRTGERPPQYVVVREDGDVVRLPIEHCSEVSYFGTALVTSA
jgi:hypothetical protein